MSIRHPHLTIVIVSYNTCNMLLDCIERVVRKSPHSVTQEIIVVDNASQDGSVEALRARFPQVRVIVNDRNVGFAAANNQAIQQSDGEYVLLLNSDAMVSEDTADRLVQFMEHHRDVGLVGCRLVNPDGSLQQSCFRYATLWRSIGDALLLTNALQFLPRFDDYRHWSHDRTREVSAVSGACVIARRQAIDQVGSLDERFFMYAEDIDWCRRFWQAGWKVAFTPATQVVHFGGGSQVAGYNERALALSEDGSRRYMLKYYGRFGCAVWSQTAIVGSLVRLALHKARRDRVPCRRGSGAKHHAARITWHIAYWRHTLRNSGLEKVAYDRVVD